VGEVRERVDCNCREASSSQQNRQTVSPRQSRASAAAPQRRRVSARAAGCCSCLGGVAAGRMRSGASGARRAPASVGGSGSGGELEARRPKGARTRARSPGQLGGGGQTTASLELLPAGPETVWRSARAASLQRKSPGRPASACGALAAASSQATSARAQLETESSSNSSSATLGQLQPQATRPRVTRVRINSTSEQIEEPRWLRELARGQQEVERARKTPKSLGKTKNHLKAFQQKLKSTILVGAGASPSGSLASNSLPQGPTAPAGLAPSSQTSPEHEPQPPRTPVSILKQPGKRSPQWPRAQKATSGRDESPQVHARPHAACPVGGPLGPTGNQLSSAAAKQQASGKTQAARAANKQQPEAAGQQALVSTVQRAAGGEAGPQPPKREHRRQTAAASRQSQQQPEVEPAKRQAHHQQQARSSATAEPAATPTPAALPSLPALCQDGQVKVSVGSAWRRNNLLAKTLSHFDEIRGNQRPIFVPTKITLATQQGGVAAGSAVVELREGERAELSEGAGSAGARQAGTKFAALVREAISKKNLLSGAGETQGALHAEQPAPPITVAAPPGPSSPCNSCAPARTAHPVAARAPRPAPRPQSAEPQMLMGGRALRSSGGPGLAPRHEAHELPAPSNSARSFKLQLKNEQVLQNLRRQSNELAIGQAASELAASLSAADADKQHQTSSAGHLKDWKRLTNKLGLLTAAGRHATSRAAQQLPAGSSCSMQQQLRLTVSNQEQGGQQVAGGHLLGPAGASRAGGSAQHLTVGGVQAAGRRRLSGSQTPSSPSYQAAVGAAGDQRRLSSSSMYAASAGAGSPGHRKQSAQAGAGTSLAISWHPAEPHGRPVSRSAVESPLVSVSGASQSGRGAGLAGCGGVQARRSSDSDACRRRAGQQQQQHQQAANQAGPHSHKLSPLALAAQRRTRFAPAATPTPCEQPADEPAGLRGSPGGISGATSPVQRSSAGPPSPVLEVAVASGESVSNLENRHYENRFFEAGDCDRKCGESQDCEDQHSASGQEYHQENHKQDHESKHNQPIDQQANKPTVVVHRDDLLQLLLHASSGSDDRATPTWRKTSHSPCSPNGAKGDPEDRQSCSSSLGASGRRRGSAGDVAAQLGSGGEAVGVAADKLRQDAGGGQVARVSAEPEPSGQRQETAAAAATTRGRRPDLSSIVKKTSKVAVFQQKLRQKMRWHSHKQQQVATTSTSVSASAGGVIVGAKEESAGDQEGVQSARERPREEKAANEEEAQVEGPEEKQEVAVDPNLIGDAIELFLRSTMLAKRDEEPATSPDPKERPLSESLGDERPESAQVERGRQAGGPRSLVGSGSLVSQESG